MTQPEMAASCQNSPLDGVSGATTAASPFSELARAGSFSRRPPPRRDGRAGVSSPIVARVLAN